MKRLLSYAACIIALGTGSVSSTALAQTFGNGPYYATPSWDQTLPTNTRFIVLSNMNNEAVLDRETGLVWHRSLLGERNWGGANELCIVSTVGGRLGWRLPTINEISSLFDPLATAAPGLPSGHPFTGLPTGQFTILWTATSWGGGHRTFAYNVGPFFLFPNRLATDNSTGLTWCVRGGLQAGDQ
jgi:Protein of unknown function (DUF1566)